jgi:Tol biopolymer transport system component
MKPRLSFTIVLVVLCAILSAESNGNARAQQGQDRGPEIEQLFNLTSYQGLEEMPYMGNTPGEEVLAPLSLQVNVPGSEIVFQSFRNLKDWNLYVLDGSSGNQYQLTGKSGPEIQPSLNRGCMKVVFASKRSGSYHIYTINLDGSGEKQLTNLKSDDVYPAWSPDGTRIVFQAYRDGNPEIYIMNADGSGQTRLTWHPGYDGTPSWSPDGSKIVFASDRIGYGGIWVMNPDGGGATQLSGIRYSYFPHWSPDGGWITFSADEDDDGWLEMWVMKADGSNPGRAYRPGTNKDAWAGSWSPDGRYASFTGIAYIYYRGNWYWTDAYLMAWEFSNNSVSYIIGDSTEWNPNWQTNDILAPTSSIQPLPTQSRGPFSVSWSGVDNGSTGIKDFDVQVKEAGGDWTDWMMATTATTASYPGIGGHTYSFRVRARDNAFNTEPWPADSQATTTVENYPPDSSVQPLPFYTRNGTAIEWSGTDTGGSGIQTYDIQYRDATSGSWIDWQVSTPLTEALFTGVAGHTYFFRSRAIDNASNQEAWPAGDGDTQTMLYTWGISGKITDNTGIPVAGATITTTPGAYNATLSDIFGFYREVVIESLSNYLAFWSKSGYGTLPTTAYGVEQDAQANIVLPPLDNVVQNSGFESGDAGWSFNGDYTPVISTSVSHTGNNTAILGTQEYGWNKPEAVLDKSGSSLRLGFDDAGNVYALWARSDMHPPQIQFVMRDINSTWSDPVSIATYDYSNGVYMVVEPDGIVHVVYNNNDSLMYLWRNEYDEWSTPVSISGPYVMPSVASFVRDNNGVLHIAWNGRMTSSSDQDFFYNRRELDGSWGTPYVMNDNYSTWLYGMAVDLSGNAHFIWEVGIPMGDTLYIAYMQRAANGTWSTPLDISGMPGTPKMIVDRNGVVHVVLIAETSKSGYYTFRDLAGNWSTPEAIPGGNIWGDYVSDFTTRVTQDGQVFLLWSYFSGTKEDIYFMRRAANGTWSVPEMVAEDVHWVSMSVILDNHGQLHIVWSAGSPNTNLYYAVRGADGKWSPPQILANMSEDTYVAEVKLSINQWEQLHIIWDENRPSYWSKIFYQQTKAIPTSGDSTLTQPITIPVQLTSPILSFMYRFDQLYTPPGADFDVSIKDGETTTPLLSAGVASLDWTHAWFNLTPWSGKTVDLIFNVHQVAHYPPVGVLLDEVTVGSANPDAWVKGFHSAGLPGEQASLSIHYGNRGQTIASGGLITVTLPASLTFVSANIAPITTAITATNVLVWDIGDLPANSGPFTLEITVALEGDITLGSNLEIPVALSPTAMELELANNTSQVTFFAGRQIYLPVIVR